jgi:hypothetical protein
MSTVFLVLLARFFRTRDLISLLDGLEERFDLVIIDSGAGIGDNVLFFVGAAQEVVLVLSPEPTSLVDAYAVVKVLSQQAGIRNFAVVINPVVDEMPARDMFQKLSTVTGRFLTAKLRHLGYIPRDENVHRAVMAQRPVVDLFPMAPASRALVDAAERLFSEPAPQILEGGMKVMWQRLMREAARYRLCARLFVRCGSVVLAMAVLSTLRRFARLGFWVGLGAGAMLIDACSSGTGDCSQHSAADASNQEVPMTPDAATTSDAGSDAQAVDAQTADADYPPPADGGKTDLWDTICE